MGREMGGTRRVSWGVEDGARRGGWVGSKT
jgi:hypothetical protein